jgi:gamma-glutamylcyclotransferase (GGCT)/AIG2-like uncharacterized protein YtfP
MMEQLFVYGSLRSGFRSPAYEYISRYFHLVGNAKVKGKLFDLGSYPGAVPSTDESFILGELYEINDQSQFTWAIAQLDDYEGVDPSEGEEKLYRRELVDAFVNNETTQAWIYWYNGDVTGKPLIASGDVLEYLARNK